MSDLIHSFVHLFNKYLLSAYCVSCIKAELWHQLHGIVEEKQEGSHEFHEVSQRESGNNEVRTVSGHVDNVESGRSL